MIALLLSFMVLEGHMENDGDPPCAHLPAATTTMWRHDSLRDWVICLLSSGAEILWSMLGILGGRNVHNNEILCLHSSGCSGTVLDMMKFVVVWSGIGYYLNFGDVNGHTKKFLEFSWWCGSNWGTIWRGILIFSVIFLNLATENFYSSCSL